MADFLDNKQFAKSKHFHSLNKDKNRYKNKLKHKPQTTPNSNQPQTQANNETINEDEEEEGEEEDTLQQDKTDVLKNGEGTLSTNESTTSFRGKGRSKFSRRKIENNDYRYKSEEDNGQEEEESSVNINELLQASAITSPSSHFRFHGEKEWDDDELLSKPLGIDCDAIGKNLRQFLTIPMQLQLDPSLFTPDLLQHSRQKFKTEYKSDTFILSNITREEQELQPRLPSTDKTQEEDTQSLQQLLEFKQQDHKGTALVITKAAEVQPKEVPEDLETWLDSVI